MATEVLFDTLRDRRRSLMWWTLGLVAVVALNIAFYPSIRDDTSLSDFGKDLPEGLRALFAGGELDISSPVGYLNSQIYALMAPLLMLVFAIGAGSGAVAGEEERGTVELLLAHPLRRREFVLQRCWALLVLVSALSVVLLATVAVGSAIVDLEIGFDRLVAATGSVALLAGFFGCMALAVGAIRPGRARATSVAAALAAAAWIFDGFGQTVDALDGWRPLSPYYQALGRNPLRDGVPWDGWVILLLGSAALIAVAVVGLERRDVRQ
jgi:ABC-2 type transport system permease protein